MEVVAVVFVVEEAGVVVEFVGIVAVFAYIIAEVYRAIDVEFLEFELIVVTVAVLLEE